MSNDATSANVDQVDDESTPSGPESDFSGQVREFKLAFAHGLHELASKAGACNVFDIIMNKVGLPARPGYVGDTDVYFDGQYYDIKGDDAIVVEDNEDDAKRWALETSRALMQATSDYGYSEVFDAERGRYVRLPEVLEFFEMPTKTTISVKVTGTFDVPFDVTGWEDANLIDQVDVYMISEHIGGAIRRGDASVQWKVQKADS